MTGPPAASRWDMPTISDVRVDGEHRVVVQPADDRRERAQVEQLPELVIRAQGRQSNPETRMGSASSFTMEMSRRRCDDEAVLASENDSVAHGPASSDPGGLRPLRPDRGLLVRHWDVGSSSAPTNGTSAAIWSLESGARSREPEHVTSGPHTARSPLAGPAVRSPGGGSDEGTPAEQGLTVPAGFEIQRVAQPPLVNRPIVADFDEDGRLYVADSSGSNDKVEKQLAERPHRIVRLEDTDGDGVFDASTVFADRMMLPQGTMWLDGSLYVAAPPSIWKLTDTDGDGVADRREEWFEGKTLTTCANDLHGPYPGPDGWIYWTKGAFAGRRTTAPASRRSSPVLRTCFAGAPVRPPWSRCSPEAWTILSTSPSRCRASGFSRRRSSNIRGSAGATRSCTRSTAASTASRTPWWTGTRRRAT